MHTYLHKSTPMCCPAYMGLLLSSAASFTQRTFRIRKEMEGEELSPWIPRSCLSPSREDKVFPMHGCLSGLASPAIPHRPWPECSKNQVKVPSGVWSWTAWPYVTSSKGGLRLINHSGFGSFKVRMWERGVLEGSQPRPQSPCIACLVHLLIQSLLSKLF